MGILITSINEEASRAFGFKDSTKVGNADSVIGERVEPLPLISARVDAATYGRSGSCFRRRFLCSSSFLLPS